MNKIFRKAVDELEKLKNNGVTENGNVYKFQDNYIDDMITVLNGEAQPCFPIIIDFYKDMEEMLSYCDLTSYERGYVALRFLENNFLVVDSKPYSYIRPEIYADSFKEAEIHIDEVPRLYQEFLNTGKVDAESIEYVTKCKKFLDITFFSAEEIDDKMVPSFPLKFPKKILKNLLIKLLAEAEKMDYELFFHSVVKFKSCRYLIQVLYNLGCPSAKAAQKVFVDYFLDKSLVSLKNEIANNATEIFQYIQIPEEKHRLTEASFYLKLKKYLGKPDMTEEDCLAFKSVLSEKFSQSLCDDILCYLDVKNSKKVNNKPVFVNSFTTKKQVVEEPQVSRKQLKKDFKDLYDEKEIYEVGFDFKNYRRLLELLKDLNYADSVNQEIFAMVFHFAQKNDDYYNVLYERARLLGKSSVVDEILEIQELLGEIPPRERAMWIDQLKCLETEITPLYEHDFDYEFHLMRDMRKS